MASTSITRIARLRGSLVLLGLSLLTGCSSLLYYPTHVIHFPPEKLGLAPEEVWFPSEDGTRIHGWYFSSQAGKDPSVAPRGLIVFFHGNAENLSSHYASLIWVLEKGYDFLIFDYRGYGRSEGSPSPRGTVMDGAAALGWAHYRLKDRGWKSTPLVVFAQSLGGAVGMRSVIESKGRVPVRMVIVDSTFPSYREAGRKLLARSPITWLLQPLACVLLSDKFAPGERISEIAPIPLIVIHGDQDRSVDYSLGQEVYQLAAEPKEFWPVPGGRHIEALWLKGGEYRKRILERLESLQAASGGSR